MTERISFHAAFAILAIKNVRSKSAVTLSYARIFYCTLDVCSTQA